MNIDHLAGFGARTTWILLAHRSGARILSCHDNPGKFKLVEEFAYPEGRRQNHDIDTDAKGSHYGAVAGRASQKHGYNPQVEAVEHITDTFAHQLVRRLQDGRTHQEFDELILVAEPGFLGKLRAFLDKETSKQVVGSVNRNLTDLPEKELTAQLREVVLSHRKVA